MKGWKAQLKADNKKKQNKIRKRKGGKLLKTSTYSCARKQTFPTRSEADATIKRLQIEKRFRDMSSYRCNVCGKYHLTSA